MNPEQINELALKVAKDMPLHPRGIMSDRQTALDFAQALITEYEKTVGGEAVGTGDYVQPVPDHCDRITWRNSYYSLPIRPDPRVAELEAEIESLKSINAYLESNRPHWAQGYSSDGVAAQCSHDALSAIWKGLGVTNQTEAMQKLAEAKVDAERYRWVRKPDVFSGGLVLKLREQELDEAIDEARSK